jgi:adenylate kinase family enzyme
MMMAQSGLRHILAGDLLQAEVATGTDHGKKAPEYMQKGMLILNEFAVTVCMYPSCLFVIM